MAFIRLFAAILIVFLFIGWVVYSIFYWKKEFLQLLTPHTHKKDKTTSTEEINYMGIAQRVVSISNEEEDISPDNFEVEYGYNDTSFFAEEEEVENGNDDEERFAIVDFEEIQQLVAVVENEQPPQADEMQVSQATLKKISDTDFLQQITEIQEKVSQRLDEIMNYKTT